jgi:MYXO-CTERM domain-containing protein
MRRVMFVGAVVALWLLAALPAQTKLTGEATISGPGLMGGGSITVDGDGSPRSGWAAFSGLMDIGATGMKKAPTSELGPRYEVVLEMRQPRQEEDIVKRLYPYAEGGALLYTPPGQKLYDVRIRGGWAAATTRLMDLLHEAGLPESVPVLESVAEPAARPDPRVTATDEGASPVVWGIVGLAGLLLVGAVTTRRRIRSAATAR